MNVSIVRSRAGLSLLATPHCFPEFSTLIARFRPQQEGVMNLGLGTSAGIGE